MSPKRILFVTRHSPLPGEHGSGAYAFDILRFLAAQGFAIDCLWVHAGINQKRGWCAIPEETRAVFRLHAPGYFRIGGLLVQPRLLIRHALKTLVRPFLKRRATTAQSSWNEVADAREKKLAADYTARLKPDIFLANYYWLTPLFPKNREIRRAVITHDVFHQRDRDMRAANVGVNCAKISAGREAQFLAKSDLIIAITDDDAATFRALLPNREIILAPKSAAVDTAREITSGIEGRCLFVGGESLPNVDGIEWFLREVWPQIHTVNPAAHLHVCGKVCTKLKSAPAGVTLRGLVDDLTAEYEQAAAVIVPLRAGSGMKIKLVEALVHGRACVSTSVGLQGLSFLAHERDVWRADEPEAFANGVLTVLREPALRQQLQAYGRGAVAVSLAPDRTYGPLAARLRPPAEPAQLSVSIVINNYNYGRFVGAAIESALAQTYAKIETIVVDDGSKDDSREIISAFGQRITAIFKTNGGQGSALNAGFAASTGEIVIFLDSDDLLHPHAVERIVAGWKSHHAKTHFRLTRIDAVGRETGTEPRAGHKLPSGEVWPAFIHDGRYTTPATSGSAYARWALENVLPMPEQPYVYAADAYLNNCVVFHGPLTAIQEPLGVYRVHGANDSLGNVLSADVGRVRYLMAREVQNDAVFCRELNRLAIGHRNEARYRYYQRLKLRTLSWKIDRAQHPKTADTRTSLAYMAIRAVWGARKLSPKERILQTVWFCGVLLLPTSIVLRLLPHSGKVKRLVKPAASASLNLPSHAA